MQPQTTCGKCHTASSDDAHFCHACGNAIKPVHADVLGREIAGRYRILSCIGQGGMGAVFRAEQLSLKRQVAIKLLRSELSEDDGLIRRFNAEAELAAKLTHPNAVTLFDFGQEADGTLFIAMELIDGACLRQVLMDGPISVERAIPLALQIASSLAHAHSLGIVHRDLKPDNIMLQSRNNDADLIKILDFGIAKLRDEQVEVTGTPVTQAGALLGTPQYMAPEQIRSETVDERTDVYALGAVLFEMVTGSPPFTAPTVLAVLGKHLADQPPVPSVQAPERGITRALDELILSAMAKDPAQRPSTMTQFSERLREIAEDSGFGGPQTRARVGPSSAWSSPEIGDATVMESNSAGYVHGQRMSAVGDASTGERLVGGHAIPPQTVQRSPRSATRSLRWLWVSLVAIIGACAIALIIYAIQAGSQAGAITGEKRCFAEGYCVVLPPGFVSTAQPAGAFASFTGKLGQANAQVDIMSQVIPVGMTAGFTTRQLLLRNVNTYAVPGSFAGETTRVLAATEYPGVVLRTPDGRTRELVLYTRRQGAQVVFVLIGMSVEVGDPSAFSASEAFRKQLFEQRVSLPGGHD